VRKDQRALLAFYDWPAEHWIHLRTTDEIDKQLSADCGNLPLRGRPCGEERGIDWKSRQAA
jgi:putative transposase